MSLSGAVEQGCSYLLTRLRAREVVSRAPVNSPAKYWDDCGEPYLAIDVLFALGDRIAAEEKEALADRLLRSQFKGAWDYSGKSGIDVDTTASAIRALDRLGKTISLDGLKLFYNPRYRLFNTFAQPLDKLDLQLPPQSPEKHLGAHPCVIANVCLLLRERGELARLTHDLLRRMQKSDGLWFSYFYPSPFYATRLFAELLTGLGEDYDAYLKATEAALLARQMLVLLEPWCKHHALRRDAPSRGLAPDIVRGHGAFRLQPQAGWARINACRIVDQAARNRARRQGVVDCRRGSVVRRSTGREGTAAIRRARGPAAPRRDAAVGGLHETAPDIDREAAAGRLAGRR